MLGELLGLRARTLLDADGRPTGVLLGAKQGNNPDITVNIYAKAGTLEPEEKALLGEAGLRWLRRHPRVNVTPHKPALGRLFKAAGMPGAPRTIASVCRAVGALDGEGNRLVDWLAREAYVRRLKLPAVVGFRSGDFERAAAKLGKRPAVVAVWGHPKERAREHALRHGPGTPRHLAVSRARLRLTMPATVFLLSPTSRPIRR